MRKVSTSLPEELYRRLVRTAQHESTSRSDLVRRAVQDFLTRPDVPSKQSFYELASDLVGKLKGPKDLATNPKYMQDFGKDSMGKR